MWHAHSPFDSCQKGRYQLNGVGAVSQLYSHWQEKHGENPAARVLEARWRLALDNPSKSAEWLDAQPDMALILSNEEMDRLGGEQMGYERVRRPTPDPTDFSPAFDLHSDEHRAWLQAEGTI